MWRAVVRGSAQLVAPVSGAFPRQLKNPGLEEHQPCYPLHSTASRPFDPPKTGKIAIKVINHYGDEVLKVYDTKNV